MKCYYEVLEVSRNADDSEIKTAYRKLALKWHPDKNLENAEEAKEYFQLLQQAYEVLSDPHERSWYDNHREQILRGKQSDYEDESLDLFQYFTVSCFKGYGDDPGGFYQVYSEVFKSLAKEDAEFMEDPEEIANYPSFGDSNSSYDDVVGPFYAFWQSYCTKKSYSWLCPYNIKEIKDRRILREIEKDMKKIVQKAKRERNEEVRNLVAFIRKRDRRVHAYKKVLEERAEVNRQKQEQNRREQILRRKKEIEEQKSSQNHISAEDYEEHLRQMEQEYGSSDEDYDDDDYSEIGSQEDPELIEDGAQYIDEFFCPACNKCFKNENAFLNHEISKKHRENLEKLKLEMLKDEENFGQLNGDDSNTDCDNLDLDEDANQENEHESGEEEEEVCKIPQKKNKGKKDKKSKRSQMETFDPADDEADVPDLLGNIALENGDDEWSDDKKNSRKQKTKKPEQKKNKASNQTKVEKVEASTANEEKPVVTEDSKIDLDHSCVTCKSKFPSKNKLFNHLKSTGHGVYIPKATKKPTASTSNTTAAPETHKKGKRNK